VKSVSELYCPLSGEVTEVNGGLSEKPEKVNTDPHGSWMIGLKIADSSETSELLDAAQYEQLTK
jgi:glycine cleavage system H protein